MLKPDLAECRILLIPRKRMMKYNRIQATREVAGLLTAAGVLPEDYDFESHKQLVPMQPGDVPVTYADTTALENDLGFRPNTSLRDGLRKFAQWYKAYYQI